MQLETKIHIMQGLLLRDKCVHNPNTGSYWASSILFSLLQELVPLYDVVENQLKGTARSFEFSPLTVWFTIKHSRGSDRDHPDLQHICATY